MQPFLTIFGGIGFPLTLFTLLAIEVQNESSRLAWENSILLAMHQNALPSLDVIAANLTQLGTSRGVIPLAIAIFLVLLYRQQWRQGLYLLTTMLGCAFISRTTKILLHRERPHLWESFYPFPSDYSFPSGHAMSSTIFVLALLILTWGSRWAVLVLVGGGLFAVAIAWTRLYLGVHFPSDILGGWLLAITWAVAVRLFLNVLPARDISRES